MAVERPGQSFKREAFGPPAFFTSSQERKFSMEIKKLLITTKFRNERMRPRT